LRVGRELAQAASLFAETSCATSWWKVGSTFGLLIMAMAGAALSPWWPLQLLFSVLTALMMVRSFITYHDYMHRSLLARSKVAWLLFRVYAIIPLTPPRAWNATHNYHHGHTGEITESGTGSFPIMTTDMWRAAPLSTRFRYRFIRHPLTVVFGYITIFLFSQTLIPLFSQPRKHWDGLLVLLGHLALLTLLWLFGGFDAAFFALLLPMFLGSALGSYLFFAQHSYEQVQVLAAGEWSFERAALESSSYLKLGPLMQWFTGNIGFHHVHHLSIRIPFYRLPDAMRAMPELQNPGTTTLAWRDIVASFRCCLWDANLRRMVSYREALAA
jgi:omega-6 fatty acid desaturase (delta-12 desaturase)